MTAPSNWTLNEAVILYSNEVEKYDQVKAALKTSSHQDDFPMLFLNAKSNYQLKNYIQSLQLCQNAIKLGYEIPEILMIKGRCLYNLGEYDTALNAFTKAFNMKQTQEASRCIERCKIKLDSASEEISRRIIRYNPQTQAQFKREWYQSNDIVTIAFFIKNLSKDKVSFTFNESSFDFTVEGMPQYNLHMDLFKKIVPTECSFTVSPSKVEIKLKKAVSREKWESLEAI